MTTPRILPGRALAAAQPHTARMGGRTPLTLAAAGALHGVTRQAVSAALRDPGRFSRSSAPGRKRTGGRRISVRLGEVRTSLWLTPAQHVAWTTAAQGHGGIGAWLAGLLEATPRPARTGMADHLRRLGYQAAGISVP